MTCKNCIHVAVCREYVTDLAAAHNLKITKIEEFEAIMDCDGCDNFADRSRFVELPCVGDKVYELCRINQFGDYKIVESEIRGFIVDTNGTAFDYELLGERFFLTHEEAEQALKEHEKDE